MYCIVSIVLLSPASGMLLHDFTACVLNQVLPSNISHIICLCMNDILIQSIYMAEIIVGISSISLRSVNQSAVCFNRHITAFVKVIQFCRAGSKLPPGYLGSRAR